MQSHMYSVKWELTPANLAINIFIFMQTSVPSNIAMNNRYRKQIISTSQRIRKVMKQYYSKSKPKQPKPTPVVKKPKHEPISVEEKVVFFMGMN